MQFTEAAIEEIHEDFFFHFTDPKDISLLIKSIGDIGLITPLPVIRTNDGYQLIAGFSRFSSAQNLELTQIPIRILNNDIKSAKHFYRELAAHLTDNSLSLIEKARVLGIVSRLQTENDFETMPFIELMEVPDNPNVQVKIKQLLSLNRNVQKYISENGLALKQCEMFLELDADLQDRLMALADELHIRAVELGVVLQLSKDISGKESVSVESVLAGKRVATVLSSEDLTRGEKLANIKEYLSRRRYPDLFTINDSLEKMKKSLKVPSAISLKWDRNLEKPGLEFKAVIRQSSDPREIGNWLIKSETTDMFEQMLELI